MSTTYKRIFFHNCYVTTKPRLSLTSHYQTQTGRARSHSDLVQATAGGLQSPKWQHRKLEEYYISSFTVWVVSLLKRISLAFLLHSGFEKSKRYFAFDMGIVYDTTCTQFSLE
ncbi:hypothetical protein VNO77_24362 [Canavalia gladiata]|uniref:Uncharacterized protein n=1 Tax=Canavalia gladiata TaxID=3824 RepID=A0AAN9L655_CANGL